MQQVDMENISIVHPEYFVITGLSGIPYRSYYYIFLFITYFVAFIGNFLVLFIIALDRRLHSPKYIGVFNLALADIGETNALIPNMMKNFLFDSQHISYNACLANMFFVLLFRSVQSVTLVVMAYDRFIAICLPLRYHAIINNIVMSLVFSGVWALNAFLMTLAVSLITRLSFCKSTVIESYFCDYTPMLNLACNDNSINDFIRMLSAALLLVGPAIIITLSYLAIFLVLNKITTWAGCLKALKTCVSHLLLVGSFFLPIMSIFIASSTTTLTSNTRIISASLSFALPPMLNPIIYVLSTAKIKYLIRKVLNNKFAPIRKNVLK